MLSARRPAIKSKKRKTHPNLEAVGVALIERWMNIYRKRPAFREIDPDDLFQEGYLGLAKAMCRFNPTKSPNFTAYAAKWIRGKMLRLAERKNRRQWEAPNSEDIEAPSESGPVALAMDAEAWTRLRKAMLHLKGRSRRIIELRFGINCKRESRRRIAARFGVCETRISQIERDALNKLKKYGLVNPDE
jgi:RNA polymerase sigma factor (sigma-70 family)